MKSIYVKSNFQISFHTVYAYKYTYARARHTHTHTHTQSKCNYINLHINHISKYKKQFYK